MARPLALAALALAALAGCRGPTRSVSLEITRDDLPLAAAHVYAIALDASDVPLPVTMENLNKAASAVAVSGIADSNGRVTLVLDAASPYWIDVAGALGAPDAAGSWVLDADGTGVTPVERKDPTLTLTLVK